MIQPDRSMLYKAFISYSHAADGKLAPAIQSALHRFARPWYKPRALRVFRDKTSLAVSPALWPAIVKALGQAEYFILFASPGAARSVWVEREVDYWLANRSRETLLIVLTEGELFWDPAAGDFDWQRSDALPKRLAGALADEPFHLDLRWAQKSEQLSLREPRFRDSVAQLASTLHGRPLDELIGEDVRQHRRTRRLAWGAVAALTLLTLVSIAAAWVAIQQRNLANERLQIATSRQLTVEALGAGREIDQALLLAVEATARFPTAEAAATLRTLLERAARLEQILHQPVEGFAFGPDGKTLALGLEKGSIELLDTGSFRPLGEILRADDPARPPILAASQLGQPAGWPMKAAPDSAATWLVFAADGRSLLASHPDSYNPPLYDLYQWELPPGREVRRIDRTHLVALSRQGHTAALIEQWGGDSYTLFYGGAERRLAAAKVLHHEASPLWLIFATAGDRMVVGYHDGFTELWTGLAGEPRVGPLELDARPISSAGFAAGGDTVYFGTNSGRILRFRLDGMPRQLPPLEHHQDRVAGLAVAANVLTSVGEGGEIVDWRLDREDLHRAVVGRLDPPVAAAFFSNDAGKLAALRRGAAEEPHRVDLWLRPAVRGFAQAAAVFTAVFDGHVTGERLPAVAADPGVQTVSIFSKLTERGSLGWSFDPPPLAFDPLGERLATRLASGGLAVWNLGEKRSLGWELGQAATGFAAVALCAGGSWLAWASEGSVELFDLAAGRHAEPIPVSSGAATAVACGPDGRTLAFAEFEISTGAGRIRLVDRETRQDLRPPFELEDELGEGAGWLLALAFDGKGEKLFSRSYSQQVVAWDLAAGTPRILAGAPETEEGMFFSSQGLALHPQRPLLAFGVAETDIALLDLAAADPRPELAIAAPAMVGSLAFHPDGDTLAAGLKDGSVHFFSLASRQEKTPPLAAVAGASSPATLAFDAQGKRLAAAYTTASGAGRLRIWDLERREPALPDFAAPAGQVLLTPDAGQLVWAVDGSGPRIWEASLEGWLARACRLANRDLTEEEWKTFLPFAPYRRTCHPYRRPPAPE
jgi:hypothetical protein